ncbi:MAG TPA: ABC transporter permease [Ohtaekwangia sp.]|uniref:ABC transporter permease n=1 Tax=Ohtaekwangia sp. TaxID=2066019 RepID=UPI002F93D75B
MIRYYFLLFFRNIKRQKLFSFINLVGLTAGIVSTLLIYLYVQHEFSYDTFHKNAENIYRINQTFIWGEKDNKQFASLGPGVAYAIKAEIPEVKEVTRIQPPGNFLVTYAEGNDGIKSFDEGNILAVDSNFFDVFTFPLVKGDIKTALKKPHSLILTESTARKYFGNEEAIGKLLEFGADSVKQTGEVTAIVKDVPDNSYIQFDMLISMNSFPAVMRSNDLWLWTTFETFVLLDERASVAALESKLAPLPRKYAEGTLQRAMNQSFDDYIKSGKEWNLFVQPFTSIHLHSTNVYNRLNSTGNITTVYTLMGVEVLIILLSCINFMNLSTAQYTRRIKESSLRKIMGSDKLQLALHFFSEAFMFCCLAALVGFGLIQILLPFFNVLTGNDLHLNLLQDQSVLWILLALIVVMSLLSGSYPAIFLSKFSPVEAMKGKVRTGTQGKAIRNGLVTFQFVISMILIVCTIVVFQQIRFLAQKDIGFDRENLLVVNRVEWVNDKETFLNALENIKGVQKASWCSAVPPYIYDGDQFSAEGSGGKVTPINYLKADEEFVSTLGLELKVGRQFSKDIPGDKDRVILNETAARALGWNVDEQILGKKISYTGRGQFEVIGVVRDFNYWSLNQVIQPMAIFHINGEVFSVGQQFAVMRVTPGDVDAVKSLLASVEKDWKQFAGNNPFQYNFVDDSFDRNFKSEEKFGHALTVFAALAILIACFGLLGMIIYTLEQRTKEIGIRKVVGASVGNIWMLIVKDYTMLIMLAIVVSTPLCIWGLHHWLEEFQYRVSISAWPFVIAGGSILITAWIITSYHVIKAALTNPVKVLKDE